MGDFAVYTFLSVPLIGAFAIFALGISVIYRASRVLNLAHGAMAMVSAYVFHTLVTIGVPMLLALPVAVANGALLGVAVERLFVRRLRPQGPTAQTVGTVAVAGLLIAFAAKIWGTTPILAPRVFPAGELRVAGAAVRYGDLGLFAVGVVVSIALFAFFQLTEVGLAMRGAAQNRRAASLMGIDPDLAAAAAWALGGGLAALAGVLLAAVTNLDPYNLSLQVLPAFVAALIGGLESLPGALVGSAIAGLAFGLVPAMADLPVVGGLLRYGGASQLALTVLALVVMATRGRRFSGSEAAGTGFGGGGAAPRRRARRPRRRTIAAVLAVLVVWPFVVPFSILGDSLLALQLALVAISLVVLIGWVGQISLASASFVGVGALVTGLATRGLGLGFPLNAVVGSLTAALAALVLGVVALRVRGLYLAVATMIFAWMADQFLFRSPWLGAANGSSSIPGQRLGSPGGFPSFDLTSRRVLYFVILAIAVAVIAALSNLRDTKTGRAFFAVRGSEVAAASLGIDVVRYKLVAFALSGLLAGIGGSLIMIDQRTVVPAQFLFTVSLQYLAIAVVGGLGSLGGAVGAGVLFAALNEVFFTVRALSGWLEVVSAGMLAVVLLAYPGGLAAATQRIRSAIDRSPLPHLVDAARSRARALTPPRLPRMPRARAEAVPLLGRLRLVRTGDGGTRPDDWFADAAERLAAEQPPQTPAEPLAEPARNGNGHARAGALRLDTFVADQPPLPPDRAARTPILAADGVVVRFGGLTAVKGASLAVREREIVGLIGPNGAGKTTMFNAMLGLNKPAEGTVQMYGRDVTSLPPHLRARLGVARTFQVIQLFTDLTVFDNLLVATHLHNTSDILSNLGAAAGTLSSERAARARVREVLRLLSLEHLADEELRGLPFGVLRMVELGRALVTGARLLMLDEPASGLNDAETDRLVEVVRGIRALGVSVLLIEHDVRMVTGVCDYIYVLDQGRMIADGTPAEIQRHPQVVAAYLGAAPADEPSAVVAEEVRA